MFFSQLILTDLPACFDSLDDDCLGNFLDFVGRKCYSSFGRINKRCHEMFCSKGLPKVTYLFGYGPIRLIQQIEEEWYWYYEGFVNVVLHYNRRDIFDWILNGHGYTLKRLCCAAIKESRLDILCEVFQRANERQLQYLRGLDNWMDLCYTAARDGKLEYLKFLREYECGWNEYAWMIARDEGHEHILQYFRNNGYPTEWQN